MIMGRTKKTGSG